MATTPPQTGPTNVGMAPNIAGLLCYIPCCVGLVFSIVVAIVEKRSNFVRFHAFQSLLLHAAFIALGFGLGIVQVAVGMVLGPLALLVTLVQFLLGLVFVILTVFMMVKAHAGEELLLPTIGDLAKGWL